MLDLLIAIVGIVLTILIIVGFHEFGHFIVARAVGIKVLRFSIGFGKPLIRWHDKKGTEYVLSAIPLGGYVKMLDTTEGDVAARELPLSYNQQSYLKKCAVIIAGPLANFLLAFFIYWFIYMWGFTSLNPIIGTVAPHSIAADAGLKPQEEIVAINQQPIHSWMTVIIRLLRFAGDKTFLPIETESLTTHQKQSYLLDLSHWHLDDLKPDPLNSLGITPYQPTIQTIIGQIQKDSPAAKTQLQPGDFIVAINNKPMHDWVDVITMIATHPEQTVQFKVKRHQQIYIIPVAIDYKRTLFFQKQGYLGLAYHFTWPKSLLRENKYPPLPALYHASTNTVDFTALNFILLGKLFTGKVSLQSLGGPITIFETAGSALSNGILPFLSFLAFLSIAIGVINILPIPGLDGGHLLINTIEWIIRRPLSIAMLNLFFRLGFILLFILIVQALVNDIMRL